MFTGIVEELGTVDHIGSNGLSISGPLVAEDAQAGDSIAVNGVCLTVTTVDGPLFTVDIMGETYQRTALGSLKLSDKVNLERAATLSSRLGGHLVQGHVDGVGRILKRDSQSEWEYVHFEMPNGISKYIVEKGSITIDGVSLTVVAVSQDELSVGLIPVTMKNTTLGFKQADDLVHFETDVIAKHVERLLQADPTLVEQVRA